MEVRLVNVYRYMCKICMDGHYIMKLKEGNNEDRIKLHEPNTSIILL